ncbi:MAG: DEAD/DEAH box helicase [Deltaproteobacteria bacterium]|nr:DEAD/DEAH box helicase [Deltaproteobacteria bacterium]MDL1962045.1 DEAD/DEAH box helicase [Deltaproteobacteria bacterium]
MGRTLLKNKRNKDQPGSWKDRLRYSFLPVIRQRGEYYAEQGRTTLKEVSQERILAAVQGSKLYTASVVDRHSRDGKILISCTCPFFRQGFPCKHLWAAIVEADRVLAAGGMPTFSSATKHKKDWSKEKTDWRTLFTDALWQGKPVAPPWLDGSSKFVLCYELNVTSMAVEVSAFERYLRKDGTLGRERKLQAATIEHRGLPRVDRAIIAMLDNISRRTARNDFFRYYQSTHRDFVDLALEPRDLELVLPLLAETKRCRVFHSAKKQLADPLQKAVPSAALLELTAEQKAKKIKKEFKLVPSVRLKTDGRDVLLSNIPVFFHTSPVLFIYDGFLFELPGPSLSWINAVLKSEEIEISQKDIRDLSVKTESLPGSPKIRLPEGIAPKTVQDLCPKPSLIVELEKGILKAQVLMNYEDLEIDWYDPRPFVLDTERWQRVKRNKDAESEILMGLLAKGFRQEDQLFQRDINGTAEVLSELTKEGWRVQGQNRKPFRGGRITELSISSGIDWFDLEGGISFGEHVIPLPKAIKAFLRGEQTVTLGDGSTGLLPEKWLSHNLPVLELGTTSGQKNRGKTIRFSSTQALILDALLEENEVEPVDRRFLEIRNALKDFSGIESFPVPADFKGVLRPYQEDAMGWFAFLKKFGFGGILADDMGLGKTVQILAWLAGEPENGKEGPSLVVSPTSVLFNWQAEAKRFVPDLKILAYSGNNRSDLIKEMDQTDLVITTYGLVRRDIETLKNLNFNYIILDESQVIKNSGSQIAKAVRLLKARYRLCLTGTPLENNVGELWSQMEFLNPGLLGPRAIFDRKFAKPIAQGDKVARNILKQMVKAFLLRRTKEAVAKEILGKMERVILCPMTDGQAKIYSQVRDHYRASILATVERQGLSRSRIKILEGLLRLRQAANHPALIGEDSAGSGKLDKLTTLIKEAVSCGHKALVFSQFTKMLSLIRRSLDNAGIIYEYLDGRTPQARRKDRVRRFQDDKDIKLFLISLKAGGLGLNLTAADYVFLVDPWWNPAVEIQAVDRTHRIGQDKKVFTYRFITAETVEEKVLALQEKKRELVSAILCGGQDMLRQLSREDLDLLFS